ncbi:hypothetical protein V8C42DRAFT_317576 [Trichoderma barbatum]
MQPLFSCLLSIGQVAQDCVLSVPHDTCTLGHDHVQPNGIVMQPSKFKNTKSKNEKKIEVKDLEANRQDRALGAPSGPLASPSICQTGYCKIQVSAYAAPNCTFAQGHEATEQREERKKKRISTSNFESTSGTYVSSCIISLKENDQRACLLQVGEQKRKKRVLLCYCRRPGLSLSPYQRCCRFWSFQILGFLRLMAHVSCLLNEMCFFFS